MALLTKVGILRMITCISNKSQEKRDIWRKGKHGWTVCLEGILWKMRTWCQGHPSRGT